MIVIDPYSRIPIYEQIMHRISELIMVGELNNGDKLPSVRVLARDLGVNPNTVQKAFTELERVKIIYTVSGKGNFVGEKDVVEREVTQRLLENVRDAAAAAHSHCVTRVDVIRQVESVYEEEIQ